MKQIMMYSMREVAQMFQVTRQTLMGYVKKHNIEYVRKFDKQVYFTHAQIRMLCDKMKYPFVLEEDNE